MQLAERRIETTRLEVARPLEVVGPRGDDVISGYTRNLSETGVRARFDGRCHIGANLLVRIALEEGAPPVEKRARVVWSAPDVYGDGTDVGLRLLSDDETVEDVPRIGALPAPPPVLAIGMAVEVECGGIRLPATISSIGDITDGGAIQVTLALVDGALFPEGDEELAVMKAPIVERAERYAATARRLWLRHGLPIATKLGIHLAAISQRAGILTARAATRLWRKLPGRVTGPLARAWEKTALPCRKIARAGRATASWAVHRVKKITP